MSLKNYWIRKNICWNWIKLKSVSYRKMFNMKKNKIKFYKIRWNKIRLKQIKYIKNIKNYKTNLNNSNKN